MPPQSLLEKSTTIDPKRASFLLRGIAIGVVLINHYVSRYTTIPSGGIANVMVSIFFVLSGYGIALSLNKRLKGRLSLPQILHFYQMRIVKLLPLLWIALFIQSLVTQRTYPLHSFFGYELEGHYWFISAILQCYLLSPFLNQLLRFRKYLALPCMTAILILANVLSSRYAFFESTSMFFHLVKSPYLEIHFLHTYSFFCGMCLCYFEPTFLSKNIWERIFQRFQNTAFVTLVFTTLIYIILEGHILPSLPLVGGLFLCFITCLYALKGKICPDFPTSKFLVFIGYHSLSIYLLHMSYYFLLERLGLLTENSINSVLVVIFLFPVFILVALGLEKIADFVSTKFGNLFQTVNV